MSRYKACQDCWQEAHPDQYFPVTDRFDVCDRCGDHALVTSKWVWCPSSPTLDHEASDTLCVWCLNYDEELGTPCPANWGDEPRVHEVSESLCIWCMEFEA